MKSFREYNAEKAARRRFEARELVNQLKSKPCKDCGNTFEPCQMDFVKREGDRTIPISKMLLKSQVRIVKEAQNSDLVCANCGRLRTWKMQRTKRSGLT
jgi:adenine C2-methylase RlmN of 23S rRNA A2503 and tRNA A37